MSGEDSAFRPTSMAAGEGFPSPHVHGGTCQRNNPAQGRHKNETRPAYIIPGVPIPCRPVPEQSSSWQPNAPSSFPPQHGLKDKVKQKVGGMKEQVEKKLHQKTGEIKELVEKALHLGNKDKKK
ncbi:unnamed protein product [Urochloa humidicola]